jgi:hypothetical protein
MRFTIFTFIDSMAIISDSFMDDTVQIGVSD